MLEDIDLEKSIDNSQIKWTGTSFLNKYALLVILSIWLILILVLGLKHDNLQFAIKLSLPALPLYLLLIIAHYKNSKSTKVPVANAPIKFRKMIEGEIIASGWKIYRSNQHYLVAEKPAKWTVGLKVGILYDKKSIFINVQNEAGLKGYMPFSFGRNKRITNRFVQLIKETDKSAP